MKGGRISWLKKWQSFDKDGDNKLNQKEFIKLLNLEPDVWSRRLFELFNRDFTGVVPLKDFVDISYMLLVYDRPTTYQTAFRLVSRRGQSFNPNFDILDREDIYHFVALRYPDKNDATHQALALAIYSFIDDDGSGGISYQEFLTFCRTNLVFIAHSHQLLETLRAGIMGPKFWLAETQRLQDIYIYDKGFFKRLAKAAKNSTPPYDFKVDFPEVYQRKLEEKSMRLLKKKEAALKSDIGNKTAFKRITKALNTLGANATGLNTRYAFYRWRDIVEEEIELENNPDKKKVDPVRATSTIWLSIVAAQDLIAADAGGTSDPYAVAELVDEESGKPTRHLGKERRLKTKTYTKTLNPVWGDDGIVMWSDIVEPVRSLIIRVSLFDADTLGSDPLGEMEVRVSDTPIAPRPPSDICYMLQTAERMKKKATGTLNLKIRHLPRTVSSGGLIGTFNNTTCAKTCCFTVVRATNLLAADKSGTSDPFATIELFNITRGRPAIKARKVRTNTVQKTLNPVWNDSEVTWPNITENIAELALKITIFDADMVSSDTLGGVTIPLLTFGKEMVETSHRLLRVSTMYQDARGEVFLRARIDDSDESSSANEIAETACDDDKIVDKIIAEAVTEMEGQQSSGGNGDTESIGLLALDVQSAVNTVAPEMPLSPMSDTGGLNSTHFDLHKSIMNDKDKGKPTREELIESLHDDMTESLQLPLHLQRKKKVGRLLDAHVALDVHEYSSLPLKSRDFERDLDHFEALEVDILKSSGSGNGYGDYDEFP